MGYIKLTLFLICPTCCLDISKMVCYHIYNPKLNCTLYHKKRIRNRYRNSFHKLLHIHQLVCYPTVHQICVTSI
nr:MAG TPA: hypothetical protein [Caudoviricetes sp.]